MPKKAWFQFHLSTAVVASVLGVLACCTAGEPAKDSHMPSLTKAQLARLNRALEPLHKQYDAAEKMIRRPCSSPGYHTTLKSGFVHPTRAQRSTLNIPSFQEASDLHQELKGLFADKQNKKGKNLFGGIVTNTDPRKFTGRWIYFKKDGSALTTSNDNWENLVL